ncbi:hypothetical protein OBBRIDRAFT_604821 [Obba rivulosa]|uniref:Uncharacterized protein n=1 Tax=Obba rivulosa TaxID=1052685 RepID=A0A8E2AY44_9APHY|nr:hypothetical protein OBBRIDRAFT_604821 [Obba rivulosa]
MLRDELGQFETFAAMYDSPTQGADCTRLLLTMKARPPADYSYDMRTLSGYVDSVARVSDRSWEELWCECAHRDIYRAFYGERDTRTVSPALVCTFVNDGCGTRNRCAAHCAQIALSIAMALATPHWHPTTVAYLRTYQLLELAVESSHIR